MRCLALALAVFLCIDVCAVRATANPDVPASGVPSGRVAQAFRREIRQLLVRGQVAAASNIALLDIAEDGPLLPGWRQATDPQTYEAYYYNTESGEERDERPETAPSTPDATMVAAFDAALAAGMAGQRTWEEAQQLQEEEQQQQVAQKPQEEEQLDGEAKQKPQELQEEQRWEEGEETEDTELNTIEAKDTDLNTIDRQQLRQLKDDTAALLTSESPRRSSEVGWKDGSSALPSTVLLVEDELGGEDKLSPDSGLDFQSIPLQRMLQMARKSAGLAAIERSPTHSV